MNQMPVSEGLSPTAMRVLAALRAQSSLGASILKTQCELARLNPTWLEEADLAILIPRLVAALGRFVAPDKVARFCEAFPRHAHGAQVKTTESAVCEALQGSSGAQGLAAELLTVLGPLVPLPVAMLKAQCVKVDADFRNLQKSDLARLVPALIAAVERFSSPEKSVLARRKLDMWWSARRSETAQLR